MALTEGKAEIVVGLIDGPVNINSANLNSGKVRAIPNNLSGKCDWANSAACKHGTLVASILLARRDSTAPAICPGCTLLVRPIFGESLQSHQQAPTATQEELAAAILDCVHAGVHVINLSASLIPPSSPGKRLLQEALDHAAIAGVIIVAAGGNQGIMGSTVITAHPWVVSVVACNLEGKPLDDSNLGKSIGRRGLSAPGEEIGNLGADGQSMILRGTSAATPFVTGAIALLLSEVKRSTPFAVRHAITNGGGSRRTTIVPPLLDAWAAYEALTWSGRAL
jgi:subtilisin family serine protease